MDARQYQEKYGLKAIGRLMDAAPNALANGMFGVLRREMVEALANLVAEAARQTSTLASVATARRHGDYTSRSWWHSLQAKRRAAVWLAAARFVRAAAVIVASALGPDPVSDDEAGTGLDDADRALVALVAQAGRASRADERGATRDDGTVARE